MREFFLRKEWLRPILGFIFLLSLTTGYAVADEWSLRMDGIGPLKIGMTFDAANKAVQNVLERTPATLRATANCDYIAIRNHPGIAFMFIDERLKRVDVFGEGRQTKEGVAVGDPVEKVFDVYRNVKVEPHAYEPAEKYLTVTSGNGLLAIRFETRDGRIFRYYAGAFEPVQFTEQCL
jgi:hypothetical protein